MSVFHPIEVHHRANTFAWVRWAELVGVFFMVPALFATGYLDVHPILCIVTFGLIGLLAVLVDSDFDRRQMWDATSLVSESRSIMIVAGLLAVLTGVAVAMWLPDNLFTVPRHHPTFWACLLVLYPALSVYPQEFLYRTLFFHRYASLFHTRGAMIVASATSFAYLHVIYRNPVAVGITFVGGLIFAWRYDRTRSLMVVWAEHSLYGLLLFTVGLGRFFILHYNGQ